MNAKQHPWQSRRKTIPSVNSTPSGIFFCSSQHQMFFLLHTQEPARITRATFMHATHTLSKSVEGAFYSKCKTSPAVKSTTPHFFLSITASNAIQIMRMQPVCVTWASFLHITHSQPKLAARVWTLLWGSPAVISNPPCNSPCIFCCFSQHQMIVTL